MLRLFALLGLVFLLVACPNSSSPVTNPDDGSCAYVLDRNINVPTKLENTPAACDYLLSSSVTVSSKLTIEPGVVVRAQESTLIVIEGGELLAVGTPEQRIVFEGASPVSGYWRGVHFEQGRESRIEYVDIKDAGQNDDIYNAGLAIAGVKTSLVNSTVSNSYVHGLFIGDRVEFSSFADNRFYGNTWAGLRYFYISDISYLDTESDYLGVDEPNGRPYIQLDVVEYSNEQLVWKKLNAPYIIGFSMEVRGGSLTLEPGVEIVATKSASMYMEYAALTAVGTAEEPIIFRGRDAERGFWEGLHFYESDYGSNRLEHVQIRDAERGLYLQDNSSVRLSESTVTNAIYGVYCTAYYKDVDSVELGENVTFETSEYDIGPECEVKR